MSFLRSHKRKLVALALVLTLPLIAHRVIDLSTRIDPPAVTLPVASATEAAGIRRVLGGYTRVRRKLREVYLEGTPEQIGFEHAVLLRERMIENEGEIWHDFAHFVPLSVARTLMIDVSKLRFRHVADGFPEARRLELAAQAAAFQPDPYVDRMPTFERMVFLHSLYDISLSFEHSPLLGCSAFVLGPSATRDGHTLLARAFDFEAGEVFDRDKAVFFVREAGQIPFASVAWPGLIGVMSGMNAEGVALVVNGARAGEPRTSGVPVVFGLREVLTKAHDTNEAVALLSRQTVMVPHLLLVTDAAGRTAVVERVPGAPAFVRALTDPDRVPLTNHFEGTFKDDPKNLAVRAKTTTLARRARLDELLASVLPGSADPASAIGLLRDHRCSGDPVCPLGDRRSIDAVIATHGVVCDTTDRTIWVSAGPHLSGEFIGYDLKRIFAEAHDPATDPDPEIVPEDPILRDGRYEVARKHAGAPRTGGDAQ